MENKEKNYVAQVRQDGSLETIRYKTDEDPIRYLWDRYGMSTYIDSVEEEVITDSVEIEIEEEEEVDLVVKRSGSRFYLTK